MRDITERKRIEAEREQLAELRRVAADLSEADRRKDEFLAMLAHELRNPLAPISNAVQVLRLGDADGDDGAATPAACSSDRSASWRGWWTTCST